MRIAVLAATAAMVLLSASAHSQEATEAAATAAPSVVYSEATPEYRFYPGDEVEVTVFSAPELTRTVTVGPDGRVAMPLIGAVRAADLTAEELHDILVSAYASHLRMPELTVTPRSYGSRQVFVGGEVARPGIYEMPANIDAFQAVALAGGFLPSARRGDVLVLSRASGQTQVSEVDLSTRAMRQGFPGAQPLQRYDVVYVPRSHISQINLFMQQYVRDALPVQFSFYYDLRGDRNN
jgi:protein involved in polysaccharide export with SLBB domain